MDCAVRWLRTAWACGLELSRGEYGRNTSLIFEVHPRWHLPVALWLFCVLMEEERLERNATSEGAAAAGAAAWGGPAVCSHGPQHHCPVCQGRWAQTPTDYGMALIRQPSLLMALWGLLFLKMK